MSKLSKALYLFLILLFGFLAAKPYLPILAEEWETIVATWKSIREERAQDVGENPKPQTAEDTLRERSLAAPKPAEDLPVAVLEKSESDELDPFLAEARERAKADPESAMLWLQEQGSSAERLRGMLEVVALWAADDSESALLWLESNAQGLARLETLNSGVELWAQRDPVAAADWIDGMANDGSKIVAAKSLASSWAASDPTQASQWLNSLPTGEVKQWASLSFIETWSEQDPRSASEWALANTLSSGDDLLLQNSIRAYTFQDPESAAQFIRQAASEQAFPYGALAHIDARAEQDPAGTVDWITGMEETDALYDENFIDDYRKAAMSAWTETDSIAASSWLSEQPLGPERDAAIAGFSESIQRFEPEAAAAWSNTISDPNRRADQLKQSVRTWANNDPEAALNWVINAELEPALQEQLARDIGVQ